MTYPSAPTGRKYIPRVQYGYYSFRSQLEARWAYFLDFLDIDYEYESDTFYRRGKPYYLPHFWLPHVGKHGSWVEIKGPEPNDLEREKAWFLAEETFRPVYIFYGDIGVPRGKHGAILFGQYGWQASPYRWSHCVWCGLTEITACGWSECGCIGDGEPAHDTPMLVEAYAAAGRLRFSAAA